MILLSVLKLSILFGKQLILE